jgi:hypothetical protein
MFIFGVLGHYLFGTDPTLSSYKDWGTMGDAFMTLFIYVCVSIYYCRSFVSGDINATGVNYIATTRHVTSLFFLILP